MIRIAAPQAATVVLMQLSLLAACASAPPGKVDFDNSNDFSKYRSFAWVSEHPMKIGKMANQPRESLEPSIMAAIRKRLESDGFRYEADAASADFLVSFTVGSREKITRDSYPSMSSSQGGRWGWGTALYGGSADASYTQGVLAIDVFDAGAQRPVWHGVAGRAISEEDREDMRRIIDEVVESILAGFPPG